MNEKESYNNFKPKEKITCIPSLNSVSARIDLIDIIKIKVKEGIINERRKSNRK